jgi:hypothetical protein
MSTGTSVTDRPAAAAIAYVFVNASGENSRPSCASRVKTGTNDSVMTRREKNSAGPTSSADCVTRFHRSAPVGWRRCSCANVSRCLCAFSMSTTAASTIAPSAIAMPPRLRMFALTPCQCITMNAVSTPTGSVTTATKAERRWNRNRAQTSATTMNSSMSLSRRLSTARSMRSERS